MDYSNSSGSNDFLAETQTFFFGGGRNSGVASAHTDPLATSTRVSSSAALADASSSYSSFSSLIVQILVGFMLYSITIWTIIGNTIVCIVVLTNKQLKHGNMSNFLIGNLALSDLLLGLTVLPFSATLSTFKTWLFGLIYFIYMKVGLLIEIKIATLII